jgi:hypothetical protein
MFRLSKWLCHDKNFAFAFALVQLVAQWKGINRKQSTRWQHLSWLKASVFFSLQKNFTCYETQQLILGTGTAIWWVTEPHYFCNGHWNNYFLQPGQVVWASQENLSEGEGSVQLTSLY